MLDKEIRECCKRLRLSQNLAEQAQTTEGENHQEFLLKLLQEEIEHRKTARIDKLISKAGFYSIKTFNGFKFDEISLPPGVTPEYLKELKFCESKTNIIMYGNVGTGKTHLSIALGVEACKKGMETRFYRTAALVNRLSEAKKEGTLSSFMKKIMKAELIICDEWGYVPLDVTGARLLFELISECYEQRTLIINTNIEFSRWINVFYDKDMTAAILDRVLHHCHLLLFPGESNRMRESSISA
ncbi:MAG TPA: ATP-binding protein [Clostridiales bacterium]|jgi:DNA replication protein DnaC|uniref:ATP-binding protein n=1 Tax=Acidilutibacter cellobiosedens TaxID=2507161 RepID=A0A410QEE5_9FIRM|nr:IS21-like element helper ATPase IstB [Acidilutibacter cellobiosedens]HBC31887.1 ATP-binding protein [Clostridiales bacterium]QAT60252.1 ATP-binding protein [Acidilutibacter cellobiosedens]QAT60439.1 ATP-binding protein [Acidilutibacter cellobiosedens]QAT62345.1 ATP-binding protein [Acidilutibacter cellobiosedens]QAT62544.1 ATP-binding protein [Acidilutibacter cellobiosedens]